MLKLYLRVWCCGLWQPYWVKLHQYIVKYIDAVTFVSKEGLQRFQETHKWNNIPSCVIDNGVLIQPIDKKQAKNLRLRVGSVGRMIPLKNKIIY